MREVFRCGACDSSGESQARFQFMNLPPVTLTGRHARLEPLSEQHLASLLRHGAETEIWRWMPTLRNDPRESVRVWFDRAMRRRRAATSSRAIIDVATGEAVAARRISTSRWPTSA